MPCIERSMSVMNDVSDAGKVDAKNDDTIALLKEMLLPITTQLSVLARGLKAVQVRDSAHCP